MTTENTEKNYAPLWKKMTVAGAVVATVSGLMIAQNLTQVRASETGGYISVADFAAGDTHATILSEHGKAYARGWNNMGQLGVATGTNVNVRDWTAIDIPEKIVSVQSAGHTVALGESGKLYTWGTNADGQIGNNSTAPAFTPTQITAVDRFKKVASGDSFTLAIDSEGRLWSWGANNAGQLGDGTTTNNAVPQMVGGSARFAEVYAAKETSYAIDTDGKLWAWGDNKDGQIGDGTTTSRNTPATVDTGKDWTQIAVSLENNTVLGIDSRGLLHSWGANTNGLLGNGTDWRKLQEEENDRFDAMIERIKLEDEQRRATLISQCVEENYAAAYAEYEAEYDRVQAEKEAAEAEIERLREAQEEAEETEQENEESTDSPQPSVSPSPSPSATPTPQPSESPEPTESPEDIVVPNPDDLDEPQRSDFTVECTTEVDETFEPTDTSEMKPKVIEEPELKKGHKEPKLVTGAYQVKDIAIGSENAYTVDVLNRLHSWGKDANGQTGLGLEDAESHTQVPVLADEGVVDVAAGQKFAAAVDVSGNLLLWGANTNGTLMSNPADEANLLEPTVKGDGFDSVTAGLTTVYAIKGQTAYAWGNNENGEVGTGSNDRAVFSATPIERKVSVVAPAAKGAVALGVSDQLMTWGLNGSGQFGNATTSTEPKRTADAHQTSTFISVTAGEDFTTAVSSDGRVWGWGSNSRNLLDEAVGSGKNYPVLMNSELGKVTAVTAGKNVVALTDGETLVIRANGESHGYNLAGIVELAAGDNHVVARTSEGAVWNWSLDEGGVREGTEPETLTQVDGSFASISAGGTISAAVTDKGEAVIWGAGSEKSRLSDKEGDVVKNFTFNNISIGNGYVLATDDNKVLWGWGENRYGVLGTQSVSEFPSVLTSHDNDAEEGK